MTVLQTVSHSSFRALQTRRQSHVIYRCVFIALGGKLRSRKSDCSVNLLNFLTCVGRDVLNLICPQCPSLSFRLMSDLKGHLETEHGINDMAPDDDPLDRTDDPSDEEDIEPEETDDLKEKVVSWILFRHVSAI